MWSSSGIARRQLLTLSPSDTWLERNRKKQRQTRILGWVIVFGLLIIVAAIVLIVLWFLKVGPFKGLSG